MASLSESEIDWKGLAKAFNKLPFEDRKEQSGNVSLKFARGTIHCEFVVAGLAVPDHRKNHTVVISSKSETKLWKKAYSTYKALKKACN